MLLRSLEDRQRTDKITHGRISLSLALCARRPAPLLLLLLVFASSPHRSLSRSPAAVALAFAPAGGQQRRPRPASSSKLSLSLNSPESLESSADDRSDDEVGGGTTGWLHNPPRPDPSFWSEQQQREEAYQRVTTEQSGHEVNEEKGEIRTGWLHNPVSPSEELRKKEEEQAAASAGSGSPSPAGGESPARKMLRLEILKTMRNHRVLSPSTFHPCGDGRRVVVTEHKIAVPLKREEDTDEDREGFARSPDEGVLLSGVGGLAARDDGPKVDVYFAVAELIEKEEDEAFFSSSPAMSLAPGDTNDVRAQRLRADAYVARANLADAETMMLYLQGGPGFGAPSPVSGLSLAEKGSWAGEALSKGFKRVVLMDQRGTGRSTPVTKQTLERKFPDLFALDDMAEDAEEEGGGDDGGSAGGGGSRVAEQLDKWETLNPDLAARVGVGLGQAAEYVARFRADSIVRDAEDVKDALLRPQDDEAGVRKARPYGAVLGQSFGGFCTMTYLSLIPNPPKICLLTGGIAPMLTPPFEVYDRLWDRVRERNLRYFERYPGDVAIVKRIVRRLLDSDRPTVRLPSGGILTARRFLQLGLGLGGSPSAFASLHDTIASALLDPDSDAADVGGTGTGHDDFTRAFLQTMDTAQPFDAHPLYYLLHESIYADADRPGHSPTDWAAHRALLSRSPSSPADADTLPPSEFDYRVTSHPSDARPTLFFGEMVFPWMARGDYAECGGFGMGALAQSLAAKDDWGRLYDESKMREALLPGPDRKCRAAAAVYHDDMYVDFDCCLKVTKRGGPLEGCKVWVTNEYQHSGLRDDGAAIFAKLLGMAKGSVGTPS